MQEEPIPAVIYVCGHSTYRIPFSLDSACGPCRGESVFAHVCVVTVDRMLTVPAL